MCADKEEKASADDGRLTACSSCCRAFTEEGHFTGHLSKWKRRVLGNQDAAGSFPSDRSGVRTIVYSNKPESADTVCLGADTFPKNTQVLTFNGFPLLPRYLSFCEVPLRPCQLLTSQGRPPRPEEDDHVEKRPPRGLLATCGAQFVVASLTLQGEKKGNKAVTSGSGIPARLQGKEFPETHTGRWGSAVNFMDGVRLGVLPS